MWVLACILLVFFTLLEYALILREVGLHYTTQSTPPYTTPHPPHQGVKMGRGAAAREEGALQLQSALQLQGAHQLASVSCIQDQMEEATTLPVGYKCINGYSKLKLPTTDSCVLGPLCAQLN